MLENTQLTQGRALSEAVMMALVRKGTNRQEVHELLRKLAIESETSEKPFREILLADKFVCTRLTGAEIDEALNPKNYLGTAVKQAEEIARKKN
jgi:adenylosuccinate lyase